MRLVATHEGGALFVVVLDNGVIEIRDCPSNDPTAVRSSVVIRPLHAAALAETRVEAMLKHGQMASESFRRTIERTAITARSAS